MEAENVPAGALGLFFLGDFTPPVPFGDGSRCLSGPFQRCPIRQADASGLLVEPDLWNHLQASPGTMINVQAWFRDSAAQMSGFNLSNLLNFQVTD